MPRKSSQPRVIGWWIRKLRQNQGLAINSIRIGQRQIRDQRSWQQKRE